MYIRLRFLNLVSTSLFLSAGFPLPVIAIALNPVTSDLQAQTTPNSPDEAEHLSQEGIRQFNLGQFLAAAHAFEQALKIYQKLHTSSGEDINISDKEIEIFGHLVEVYGSLNNSNKVSELSKKGLALSQKLGNRATELKLLTALGNAYNYLGEYETAINLATASLALSKELQNYQAQAVSFITLATAYEAKASNNSDYQKAIAAAISGLTTAWKVKDYKLEAKALSILGSVDSSLNKNQNAIVFSREALKLAKANNLPTVAASSLLTLGDVYLRQREYQKVTNSVEPGRNDLQQLQQRFPESVALVMLSLAYLGQGNFPQSLSFAEQELVILKEAPNPQLEALTLIILSLNYSYSQNSQKAIELINQSLLVGRKQKDRNLEAFILEVRGNIYRKLGQTDQAIASYQEAISITESYTAMAGLARSYEDANLWETAITYYKQAINNNEARGERLIPGLPMRLQASFPQAVQNISGVQTVNIYRYLANLLLSQRRLNEAQQVLELLKGEELHEYTGNNKVSPQVASLTITPTEEQIIQEYGSLISFGNRVDECEQTHCPESKQLSEQRAILTKNYYQVLGQLEAKIRSRAAADEAFVDPNQFALKAQEIVEAQPGGTVLIYPLVLEDKIWLMWASKGGIFKSVEVKDVTQARLEKKVSNFRQLLQNRLSNIHEVNATGKQLYDWLLKPLEQELKANNIHNLVFCLDRSTRYIPMSALFDGQNYLIENYNVSTVLSAKLTKAPAIFNERKVARISTNFQQPLSENQEPTVLAMGVSNSIGGFKPLPYVPLELNAIVRHDSVQKQGIFPGQEFLNKDFDFFALRDNLPEHQILHIATHSQFVPTRAYESFLLLGSGDKLEIPEIETWLNLRNVNLVVLSACETALGGSGQDGREIAAIAYYFLKGGAKTVIASLWNVDDQSTRFLMEEFYKNLAKGTPTAPENKAEALRQAQLALLNNSNHITDKLTPSNERIEPRFPTTAPSVERDDNSQPSIAENNPFRHPYYWSPFILIGSGL